MYNLDLYAADLVVDCSPPLLILSENYRYVLLKQERHCEHFLEIVIIIIIIIIVSAN